MDFMDLMDKLSEEQRKNAILVATAAAKAGVDPTLAVAIAYQESRLNPNVGRGSSGEIGMMQIMPSTGKGMGYDEKALADPQKNIEAGINYLRRALLATDNDPKLAAVFYNGGPNALELLRAGKEPDPRVINYVKSLDSYGTFAQAPQGQPSQDESSQTESVERDPNLPPPAETDDELVGIMDDMRLEAQMLSDAEAQEKRQAQIYGAGAGAALATTRAAGSVVGNALEAGARRVGAGLSATSAPQAGALPPAAATTAPPAASAGAPRQTGALPGQTGPRTPPPLPGLTLTGNIDKPYAGFGSGNANYGWKFQLPDIELGKVASMGSDEEGAQRFIKERAEGMARARSAAPGSILVERPSGLLETISTGGKPKFSGTQLGPMPTDPGDPRNLFPGLSQPGQVQERTPQAPQKAPTPTVVSKPSGLDYISGKFMDMMRNVGSGASTALRYAAPPLTLASAAGEGVNIAQQLGRPSSSPLDAPGQAAEPGKQRDYTSMGLSGLNILGAGMSVLPRFSPYGIPLTLGTAAYQAYRDDPKILEKMRQKIFSSDYPEQMVAP